MHGEHGHYVNLFLKLGSLLVTLCLLATTVLPQAADHQVSDIPYVPTPQPVVEAMLKLANVRDTDFVVDLGSGDGRIVITAAKEYHARALGVELDHALVSEARATAVRLQLGDKATFVEGDLFRQDLRKATVVTVYLTPSVNLRLRPKLRAELAPGTRVVSHRFDMGNWQPEKTEVVDGETIYRWTIPGTPRSGSPNP